MLVTPYLYRLHGYQHPLLHLICQRLADSDPAEFLPRLAMALNNQSSCLWALRQPEEALAAIEEAGLIYQHRDQARWYATNRPGRISGTTRRSARSRACRARLRAIVHVAAKRLPPHST
jgi:hypothetical protein